MGTITVGTSSWADPGFIEEWYPRGLPARDRLGWYAERFAGVEVNSTFYALPAEGTVARWAQVTPDGFTFDVKLHRALSRHAATLDSLPPDLRALATVGPRGRVVLDSRLESALAQRTLEATAPLAAAGKLSSFLLQLSPAFGPRDRRLDELTPLIAALAPTPVAIELRHRDWLQSETLERTLDWYEQAGAAFVCVDGPPVTETRSPTVVPTVDAVTRDDLAYLRAHGRNTEGYLKGTSVAERFNWQYSDDELRELVGRAHVLSETARDVRTMFNNNAGRLAPDAATRARELLGQDPGPDPDEPEPAQQTLL